MAEVWGAQIISCPSYCQAHYRSHQTVKGMFDVHKPEEHRGTLAGGNTKEGLLRNELPVQTPLRFPQEILSPSAQAQNPSPQIIRNSLHFSWQTKGYCCLLVDHIMGCRRVYWNCTGLLLKHLEEEPKVEKRRDLGNLGRNVCKKLKEKGIKNARLM